MLISTQCIFGSTELVFFTYVCYMLLSFSCSNGCCCCYCCCCCCCRLERLKILEKKQRRGTFVFQRCFFGVPGREWGRDGKGRINDFQNMAFSKNRPSYVLGALYLFDFCEVTILFLIVSKYLQEMTYQSFKHWKK